MPNSRFPHAVLMREMQWHATLGRVLVRRELVEDKIPLGEEGSFLPGLKEPSARTSLDLHYSTHRAAMI
jgi:hypothetical protein